MLITNNRFAHVGLLCANMFSQKWHRCTAAFCYIYIKIKLPTSVGSSKKAREFQKNMYFCFIDYTKAFECLDQNKLWKILGDGNTWPPDVPPEKSVGRSRSNSYVSVLDKDTKNVTVSALKKEFTDRISNSKQQSDE